MGPLQDPVTWYGINYAGTQITQWDFQNKGKSGWTGTSSFVLEVPLRNLRPSVINSVPCDRILQRAHCIHVSSAIILKFFSHFYFNNHSRFCMLSLFLGPQKLSDLKKPQGSQLSPVSVTVTAWGALLRIAYTSRGIYRRVSAHRYNAFIKFSVSAIGSEEELQHAL